MRRTCMQTIIRVIKLNRAVQYFANLYGSIRLDFLERKTSDLPIKVDNLSTTEHQRIPQAFLRGQTMMNLCGGYEMILNVHNGHYGRHYPERPIQRLVGLFQSWEMEQVAEVTVFIRKLCLDMGSNELRNSNPKATSRLTPRPTVDYLLKQHLCNIQAFHHLLVSASKVDPTLDRPVEVTRSFD
jgi:hypothetical protein